MYAITKMVLYATIIPINLVNANESNLIQDLIHILIEAVEIIFIFYILKKKSSFANVDECGLKVITIGVGWSLADSLCMYLLYFLTNAIGEEFTWEYIQAAIQANINLIEKIAIVAFVQCIQKINFEGGFSLPLILVVIGKYLLNGLAFKYIKELQFENEWKMLGLKAGIALVFGLVGKMMFNFYHKSEDRKALEAYEKQKKNK